MAVNIFNGWEWNRICVDCNSKVNDLTLEEAKQVAKKLQEVISSFEKMDQYTKEYFEEERKRNEKYSGQD